MSTATNTAAKKLFTVFGEGAVLTAVRKGKEVSYKGGDSSLTLPAEGDDKDGTYTATVKSETEVEYVLQEQKEAAATGTEGKAAAPRKQSPSQGYSARQPR